MGTEVPLGRRESQHLEFKGADALKHPFSISREVVAMLNADGGSIWIGVREDSGYAVEVEGLANVELAKENLLNHLLEVVEPRLRWGADGDIAIEEVEHEGRSALRLDVRKTDRGPFAQLKSGGRHFVIRVDHRICPMTREEVFRSGGTSSDEDSSRLKGLRQKAVDRDEPGLWIGIEPRPLERVDVQDARLQEALVDPSKSGNRMSGWSFGYGAGLGIRPEVASERIEYGRYELRKTTVWTDGCVEFWASLAAMYQTSASRNEIHPLALLEYTVAIMRLAAYLLGELVQSSVREVVVDRALIRASGWCLPAYAPGTYGYLLREEDPHELEEDPFLPQKALQFHWETFRETPDYAGYMVVRSIYGAFGLGEDRIPREYDRLKRRLLLED